MEKATASMNNGHAFLVAGILAGIAGLLTFLTLHALWIMPIWFILPLGLLISGVGGLAVGWSYSETEHRLPERPWRTLAVVALIMMILLPSLLLGELRQPMFQVSAAGVVNLAMGIPEAVVRFIGELLLTAIMAAVIVVSSLVLVETSAWLAARSGHGQTNISV